MASQLKVPKDPNDIDDLLWDWTSRVRANETVTGFSASVVGGDVAVPSSTFDSTLVTSARVTGGTSGVEQRVRGRVTFSSGRQLDWTMVFTVADQ